MAVTIRKAERRKAKLRLGLMGSSGSGKTFSALKLAFGLGGKVGLIDTEHGSGELYASEGDYDVIQIEAPYTVFKYREAIRAFEEAGYSVIIIDSLSHAWAGEGGLLDRQGQLEKSGKVKNSFAAWRELTPEHNQLVEELLNSPAHIIGTMRSKTEYVLELNDRGKQAPRKVGMAPIQRDGMEYEFTVVLDINDSHYATATKDRTNLFDGWCDRISRETGKKLLDWLESGKEALPKPVETMVQETFPEATEVAPTITIEQADELTSLFVKLDPSRLAKALRQWNIASLVEIKTIDYDRRLEWLRAEVERAGDAR